MSALSNLQLVVPHCRISIVKSRLHFHRPATTSRGAYQIRNVWYVWVSSSDNPGQYGVGECAPLPDLSCDALPDYEDLLYRFCRETELTGKIDIDKLRDYPSILFGLETAFLHYHSGDIRLWDSSFSRGEEGILINGLIWMDTYENMLSQIDVKLKNGFRCVKLKIGSIDFEEELSLLQHIRKHYPKEQIELRVDANGAFAIDGDAMDKLHRLAKLDIHSIEQPIRAGQWEAMARLTANTPLPIALDEELIGVNDRKRKRELLEIISPQYIILKPSLHGGFTGCTEWIEEAERLGIGWWITSALESNVGLNAIAQWTATFNNPLPQGLGTGLLYRDNINLPLTIKQDRLWFYNEGVQECSEMPTSSSMNNDLYSFLSDWFASSEVMPVHTSGSTGTPKLIYAEKARMKASSRITCDALGVKRGATALLCMPLQYIAGKMMVVRSIEMGMQLIVSEPSGHPLCDMEERIDFAAMTPMQLYNTLLVPKEKDRLKQIAYLLIGGGEVSEQILHEIKDFPNIIYATYGMTETLSHIALRRINGNSPDLYYTPFSTVNVSITDRGTLRIEAPLVSAEVIETNDVAEVMADGRFRILGRIDNVINSGGVKIQAEAVERKLSQVLDIHFVITSIPHPQLGEAVALLTEGDVPVQDMIVKQLNKYECPKFYWKVKQIPLTGTGKIDRKASRMLALSCYKTSC